MIVSVATPAFGVQRLLLDLLGRRNVTFSQAPQASNVIKKRFYDLGLGAPPRNRIQALAGQIVPQELHRIRVGQIERRIIV